MYILRSNTLIALKVLIALIERYRYMYQFFERAVCRGSMEAHPTVKPQVLNSLQKQTNYHGGHYTVHRVIIKGYSTGLFSGLI